jgi:hypothetical protein
MEVVCFKRHEENPLDTLEIGRVEERRKEKYQQFVNGHIENIQILFAKYKGVSMQGWENVYDRNPSYSDPFDGVIIKFTITTFPFPSIEKILTGEFETRLKTGTSFVSLYTDPFNKTINQFGSSEECYDSLETWIQEFTKKPEIKFDRW